VGGGRSESADVSVQKLIESVDEGDDDDEEGSGEDEAEDEEDVAMDEDAQDVKPAKASDPNDMSAYNMDDYDNEESKGVGEHLLGRCRRRIPDRSYGRFRQHQRFAILPR